MSQIRARLTALEQRLKRTGGDGVPNGLAEFYAKLDSDPAFFDRFYRGAYGLPPKGEGAKV